MTLPRTNLPLPLCLALPVLLLGGLCTVLIGGLRYAEAVQTERQLIHSFVEAAERAVVAGSNDSTFALTSVTKRLRALRGHEAICAWRVLDSDSGAEVLRSPYAADFDMDRVTSLDRAVVWTPGPGGMERLDEAAFWECLVIRLPYVLSDGSEQLFEAVIDGPERHRAALRVIAERLTPTAAGFLLICLLVLALTDRWVGRPLAALLAALNDSQASDEDLASVRWFGLSGLVPSVDAMRRELREQREDAQQTTRCTQHMIDAAAKGLLSVDRQGVVCVANQRAAHWLGAETPEAVVGRSLADFVDPADRARFLQLCTVEQPDATKPAGLRVRLVNPALSGEPVSLLIAAFDGATGQAPVVLQPHTRRDALHDRLSLQQRLLQAAVDAIPEPWLLTDTAGKVLVLNRAWAMQARRSADALLQSDLGEASAWSAWGSSAATEFVRAVTAALAGDPASQPTEIATPEGPRVLHAEPTFAGPGTAEGFVWTLREPVANASGEPSLAAAFNLEAAAGDLREARTTRDLLDAAVDTVRQWAGTSAAGIAVRAADPIADRRSDQRLALFGTSMPLAGYVALRDAAESDLMPEVMSSFSPRQMPRASAGPWGQALHGCGLDASVAVTLRGLGDDLGVLWIAERRGKPIDPSAVQAMERLAEIVSARLDTLRLLEMLGDLGLFDAVTGLPTTPALLRHLQVLPAPSDTTTSHHLIVFSLNTSATALRESQRQAFMLAAADRLRARCRRNVLIAATGPTEFAVAVHGMATQHAEGLGQRLLTALRALDVPGIDLGRLAVGRMAVSQTPDQAAAQAALDAARKAAAAEPVTRRRAS